MLSKQSFIGQGNTFKLTLLCTGNRSWKMRIGVISSDFLELVCIQPAVF